MTVATWSSENLNSVAEMATDKISVNDLTIHNYVSTENMLPERQGVELATKLPTSGNVNAFRPGDVLFSNIRTYFKKVWLAPWHGGASADVIIFRPRSNQKINNHFLYYLLSSDAFIESTVTASKGTKMPRGDKDAMRTYEFGLPPLTTQQRIVEILSTYDELIENSQQRIKILESMARAIYREWFVQFRFPGHESIPLVPSSLGDIPEGWEVKKLGDVVELKYGKGLKKEDRRDGEFPVFGSSGIVGTHDMALVKGPGIVVGRKGNVGSVFWCDKDFFVIDTAYYITSSLPFRYLFYVLPTLNFLNSDAAVPGLSRNQAYTLEVRIPPASLLHKFCEFADVIQHQVATLETQIQNLRSTRDLLLPHLLSGQIDVFRQDEEGAA
jgi:type I restriction enzyme S subunit